MSIEDARELVDASIDEMLEEYEEHLCVEEDPSRRAAVQKIMTALWKTAHEVEDYKFEDAKESALGAFALEDEVVVLGDTLAMERLDPLLAWAIILQDGVRAFEKAGVGGIAETIDVDTFEALYSLVHGEHGFSPDDWDFSKNGAQGGDGCAALTDYCALNIHTDQSGCAWSVYTWDKECHRCTKHHACVYSEFERIKYEITDLHDLIEDGAYGTVPIDLLRALRTFSFEEMREDGTLRLLEQLKPYMSIDGVEPLMEKVRIELDDGHAEPRLVFPEHIQSMLEEGTNDSVQVVMDWLLTQFRTPEEAHNELKRHKR